MAWLDPVAVTPAITVVPAWSVVLIVGLGFSQTMAIAGRLETGAGPVASAATVRVTVLGSSAVSL